MIKDFENMMLKAIFNKPSILTKNIEHISNDEMFVSQYNKFLLQLIIEHYRRFNEVPCVEIMFSLIRHEAPSDIMKKILRDHFELVMTIELTDGQVLYIEEDIKNRLKDNIIIKAGSKLDKLSTEQIEGVLTSVKNLQEETPTYEIKHIWDELDNEERQPIPTGLELIDEFGIAKGEIGLLLAGTGVGKSVFLTYLASNFMLRRQKVLHIVFEGSINTYLRAHRTKLGSPTTEQLKMGNTIPYLRLVKMKPNGTTTKDIEGLINTSIQDGFIPDVIVIDYLDCLIGNGKKEIWQNDISIVNELEHLCQKYNVALWSAVQSNRSGLNKELTLENTAGSISKTQKASFLLALTRTPEQQENNKASVVVLKNRFGVCKASYDCLWAPDEMKIELPIKEKLLL